MNRQELLTKAQSLPNSPGCYLMKRRDGSILYVGKAKNLKKRVTSYFNQSKKTIKTEILVSHINDFDFFITANETEAFILENNLIKKHVPKYNIRLKDDKSYPYIQIDLNEPFPRLQYVRKTKKQKDGIKYFGPFVTGSNVYEVLKIIVKSLSLRDCSLHQFRSRKEPCLLYQMNQCQAPCVGLVSKSDYEKSFKLAIDFFDGFGNRTIKVLREKMNRMASQEEFEFAAILRDYIEVLEEFLHQADQSSVELGGKDKDIDIISYYSGEKEIEIAISMIRNNMLLGHKHFNFLLDESFLDQSEEFLDFVYQYYTETNDSLPNKIVLSCDKKDLTLLEDAISSNFNTKIKIVSPGTKYRSLMKLTSEQAKEHQRIRLENKASVYNGLNKLKELLGLKIRPKRLECFDVAIWQGSSPTASQVVFIEGEANKKAYRHYNLTKRNEGNNDYAMMKELLERRVKKGDLPDVFIIDGGIGQVNVVRGVLSDMNLSVPAVGIAKSKSKKGSDYKDSTVQKSGERLIIPGRSNPYLLRNNRSLFNIVVQMRDEAHRFSRRLHHKMEKKRTLHSWLDEIKGVGPKIKAKILERIDKNPKELKKMSAETLKEYLNITLKVAYEIKKYLDKKEY